MALALFDYLPVALSAAGLWLLAQLLAGALPSSRIWLLAGLGLIVAGGLSKATWKLIWVLARQDLALLDALLFVCVAPGMILLACHAVAAARRWRNGAAAAHPGRSGLTIAIAALAAAAAAASFAPGRAWFFLLLAAATLANIVLAATLARLSWGWGQGATGGIFLFSLALTLCLGALARISAGSAPLQWLAECLNLLAQGAFALAAWRLRGSAPPVPAAR